MNDENKIGDVKELRTIDDHLDLLLKLLYFVQQLPQCDQTNVMVDNLLTVSTSVVNSVGGLIEFVVKNSKKYQKKPSFFERLRQVREEERQRKLLERLEDEEYAEYLRQKETQAQAEEAPQEHSEGEEQPEAGLPVVQPTTSPEVVEKADDGTTKPMEW